ncbi:MAG: hypothetical protein M3O50_13970 [Myxococcota bacterium]|nr:hypothetical protein [Myxococcota bacterium]
MLVAVTVADAVVTTAGAVYNPVALIDPTDAVHVTPGVAVPSLGTVAANCCVAPPIIATGTVVIVTVTGTSVIVAVAVFVVSLMLVAVSVTVAAAVTGLGAVYVTPVTVDALSVPPPLPMLHVTPADASFVVVAVNACAPPLFKLAVAGATATVTAGGVLLPPQPTSRAKIVRVANTREKERRFMGRPHSSWKIGSLVP